MVQNGMWVYLSGGNALQAQTAGKEEINRGEGGKEGYSRLKGKRVRVWTHRGTDLTFYSLSYFELVLVDEKNREFKGKAYVGHTDLISSLQLP